MHPHGLEEEQQEKEEQKKQEERRRRRRRRRRKIGGGGGRVTLSPGYRCLGNHSLRIHFFSTEVLPSTKAIS